jgi:hypothetical protein
VVSGLEDKLVNKSILIQMLPDPYATVTQSLVQRVFNITNNLNAFSERIKETDSDLKIESLELLRSSSSSEANLNLNNQGEVNEKIPAFLSTKNFNYVITQNSLVITLNVMNTDALVWIEILPRTPLTKAPKSVEEIALSSGAKVFVAQKGIPLDISLTGIISIENYVFFGAQDMLTKGYSKVYSFSINMDSKYCSKLRSPMVFIIFLMIIAISHTFQ